MTATAGCCLTRWKSAATAVRGRAHEASAEPLQDAVADLRRNGVVAIALADGAGSARHSALGAARATRRACALICDGFESLWALEARAIAAAIAGPLQEELRAAAIECSAPVSELASTLLFVAVSRGRYLAGSIGDGIAAMENGSHARVLFSPQRGEHLNETVFLTSSRLEERLQISKGPSADWFCLMSDGTAETFYQRQNGRLSTGPARVAGWLREYREVEVGKFLTKNLRDQLRERTGDDCSLAVLARVSLSLEDFHRESIAYQREFLGCRSRDQLTRRLKAVERTFAAAPALLSAREASNLRRHYRALGEWLDGLPDSFGILPRAAPDKE
jgi:hypothetical protein